MEPLADEQRELELKDYLRVIARRKWIVILVPLLTVAAALGVATIQTPVYRATAEVLLQPRTTESIFDPSVVQNLTGGDQAPTEIRVVQSDPVRAIVAELLGESPGGVSVSNPNDTDFLLISAESTVPARAAEVANAYAEAYVEHRRRVAVSDLEKAADDLRDSIAEIDDALRDGSTTSSTTDDGEEINEFAGQSPERLQSQRDFFSGRLDQIRLAIRQKTGGAQLQTPADVPTDPVRPTPQRDAILALVVGVLLGVGLAFLRDYLDESIKSKEDMERTLPGKPVLGLVPEIPGWRDRSQPLLIAITEPRSPGAEAYRALRTSVQFLGVERALNILQVTSASQTEGKSTTVANVAVALAQAGQRVTIVDCDLRRPRVHEFFGIDHAAGLTSVLIGDASIHDAVLRVVDVPNLYVLPSGPRPPNPSELLAGNHVSDILQALSANSFVVIDSPPVLPVTDAVVLSKHVDGVLLLATAGMSRRKDLRRAHEVLDQVGAPILGTVLNGISSDDSYGYSYRYQYGYAYGDTVEEREAAAVQR